MVTALFLQCIQSCGGLPEDVCYVMSSDLLISHVNDFQESFTVNSSTQPGDLQIDLENDNPDRLQLENSFPAIVQGIHAIITSFLRR